MAIHDRDSSPSGTEILLALEGALECLEWTETTDTGEPLDSLGFYFTESARESVKADLISFIESNQEDLDGIGYGQIGHDFILTRNHHGAGFWDRGLGDRGDRLTESAHAYGSVGAFVTDSDELEIQ
jgi:hypothetical protein